MTLYYVEQHREFEELSSRGGVLDYLSSARQDGVIRKLGVTTHQRPVAVRIAESGRVDTLMIRYNAAHRGAEVEVFPTTDRLRIPVIAYTALRWGGLLRPTSEDPPGFVTPRAPNWYRFVLQSPSVSVTLAAPQDRAELDEALEVLHATGPLSAPDFDRLAEHGDRVRRLSGRFP